MITRIGRPVWQLSVLVALAVAPVLSVAASPQPATSLGEPVSDQTLAQFRGGYDVNTINQQDLNAALNDNQAYNNITGTNQISGQAFSGASGVPTVIQNSGNNVIIQNATILNVQVR